MSKAIKLLLLVSCCAFVPQQVRSDPNGPWGIAALVAGAVISAGGFVYSVKGLWRNVEERVQIKARKEEGVVFACPTNMHLELGELDPEKATEEQLAVFAETASALPRQDVRDYAEHISNAIDHAGLTLGKLYRQELRLGKKDPQREALEKQIAGEKMHKKVLKNRVELFRANEPFFRGYLAAKGCGQNCQPAFEALGQPDEAQRLQDAVKAIGGNSCFAFVRIMSSYNTGLNKALEDNEEAFARRYPAEYKRIKDLQIRLAHLHNKIAEHPCYKNDYRRMVGEFPGSTPHLDVPRLDARQLLAAAQSAVRVAGAVVQQ